MFRLAVPGFGHFGLPVPERQDARNIAQEVANEQRTTVEITDSISITDVVEPQEEGC